MSKSVCQHTVALCKTKCHVAKADAFPTQHPVSENFITKCCCDKVIAMVSSVFNTNPCINLKHWLWSLVSTPDQWSSYPVGHFNVES